MNTSISMADVMSALEGNECYLKTRLSREGRATAVQYYALRARYCKAKFNEIHGGKPAVPVAVPRSIIEFWEQCDRNIRAFMQESGASFDATGIEIPGTSLGTVTIDAIGKTSDHQKVIFKIVIGGSWRNKHAVQLVKEMDEAIAAGIVTGPEETVTLMAFIAGGDDPDIKKATRVIQRDAEYAKNGNLKTPSWAMMRDQFNDALEKARQTVAAIETRACDELETNPVPTNCAYCPFHNTEIEPGKTCSGYYHDI